MHKYRLVAKKGEGTFSEVLKAQCIKNGKYVAIKCMKNHFDSLDQVNNLREIQALRRLSPHTHIVKLIEVLYDQPTGRLALVFELMDMNIYELIRGRRHYVAEDRIKNYMYQLMKSMDHMHRNGIFHRDIKPENILIMDDCLKLADFGSCRGIYSKQPYTEYISTRWYRAPECLLTDGYYNYKMDMWGVGCVFFEIVSLFPLFPGTNELDQIQKIHNILGTPPPELLAKMKKRSQHMDFNFPPKEGTGIPKLIPHVPAECVDLICKLLAYNPDDRCSARQALRHPYFRDLREAEKRQKALASPEAGPAGLSSAPGEGLGSGTGQSGGGAVPETTSKSGTSMTGSNRRVTSPNGSEGIEDAQPGSPPEANSNSTARQSEGAMGLPSISKQSHPNQGHHHDGDDGADDSALPPIGNLSLGKANMATNSIRRGGLPNLMAKAGVAGPPGAAAGAGASNSSNAGPSGNAIGNAGSGKRLSMPAGAGKYGGNKVGGAPSPSGGASKAGAMAGSGVGGGGALGPQPPVKYPSNNAGKANGNASNNSALAAVGAGGGGGGKGGGGGGGGKYLSPYSLRNLANE